MQLDIPHRVTDCLCPVSGLCDVYAWKTGARLPEELAHYGTPGFASIANKRANPPLMVFLSKGMKLGLPAYRYWSEKLGFALKSGEGGTFANARKAVRAHLDAGVPALLFGLDMFYLPYQTSYCGKLHIEGHIVLAVGYDAEGFLVYDNAFAAVQRLSDAALEAAWAGGYPGFAKKNAYFALDMATPRADVRAVLREHLRESATAFLNPPVGFLGIRGAERWQKALPDWPNLYDAETRKGILTFFVTFTGSLLPERPEALGGLPEARNPHKGCRDRLANALEEYADALGAPAWREAARDFRASGEVIAEMSALCTEAILDRAAFDGTRLAALAGEWREIERAAQSRFL